VKISLTERVTERRLGSENSPPHVTTSSVRVHTRVVCDSRNYVKIQDKVHPRAGPEGPEGGYRYFSTLSLTSALDGGGWSTPYPGRFTPGEEARYPLHRSLGGPQGRVWTGAVNLARNRIRSPDRPAFSKSLYRLSYPGPPYNYVPIKYKVQLIRPNSYMQLPTSR
jgi:hypothetical protein